MTEQELLDWFRGPVDAPLTDHDIRRQVQGLQMARRCGRPEDVERIRGELASTGVRISIEGLQVTWERADETT